jgi:hypothetical protein
MKIKAADPDQCLEKNKKHFSVLVKCIVKVNCALWFSFYFRYIKCVLHVHVLGER